MDLWPQFRTLTQFQYMFLLTPALITTIILSSILVSLLRLIFHRRTFSHIPGPPLTSFISGHLRLLQRKKDEEGHCYFQKIQWAVTYGDIYVIWIFNNPMVSLTNPGLIHKYFTKAGTVKFLYPFLDHHMGVRTCGPHSLFNEPGLSFFLVFGNKWRRT